MSGMVGVVSVVWPWLVFAGLMIAATAWAESRGRDGDPHLMGHLMPLEATGICGCAGCAVALNKASEKGLI